jgi:hypothetical protein
VNSPSPSGRLPVLDPDTPTPARIYDYLLGGTHNFAADQEAAQAMIAAFPALPQVLRAVREFVRRATGFLAGEAKITQFLDLGSGIPTVANVHEIAQGINSRARVAYVDIDPMAVVHSRTILAGNRNAICIQGDLRHPGRVVASKDVQALIDFSQPVAVLMSAVLHFIEDDGEARQIVDGYMKAVPPGSYLVICHHSSESHDPAEARAREVYTARAQPLIPRSREQIARFFHGLTLIEPGIVLTPLWRPDPRAAAADGDTTPPYFALVGVGRKD